MSTWHTFLSSMVCITFHPLEILFFIRMEKHFGEVWNYFHTLKGTEMKKTEDIVHNALTLTNKTHPQCHE